MTLINLLSVTANAQLNLYADSGGAFDVATSRFRSLP